jgi:hypothetical protein
MHRKNKEGKSMERKFKTLIKSNEKLGNNKFVKGKIVGYLDVICQRDWDKNRWPIDNEDEGAILTTKCEPKLYEEFEEFTERRYPGLCVFDAKM